MALVLKECARLYKYVIQDLADKRIEPYPMMGSPIPMVTLLIAYMLFVLKIGPKYMENREPFKLKKIMIAYNIIQIACNAFFAIRGSVIFTEFNWVCEPIDYGYTDIPLKIVFYSWFYFTIKVTDLLDTVFFVLRKKEKQVTFLHVYHHATMVFACWVFAKYYSGGHGVFVPLFNCTVHTVMYGYYLLTALSKNKGQYIWWKKYITQMQLVQFMLVYIFYVPMIFVPTCKYPKAILWVWLPQNTLMVYLFGTFYYKNYIKKVK